MNIMGTREHLQEDRRKLVGRARAAQEMARLVHKAFEDASPPMSPWVVDLAEGLHNCAQGMLITAQIIGFLLLNAPCGGEKKREGNDG